MSKIKTDVYSLIKLEVEKLTKDAIQNLEELANETDSDQVTNWLYSNCTDCPKDYVDCSCPEDD